MSRPHKAMRILPANRMPRRFLRGDQIRVEGLSLSVATEVEKFGIKITVVEPGFFRTELMDARNIRWASNHIDDYAAEGPPRDVVTPITASNRVTRQSWATFW